LGDHIGHRKRLTRTGRPEQHLRRLAGTDALDQSGDRFGMVARGRKRLIQLEIGRGQHEWWSRHSEGDWRSVVNRSEKRLGWPQKAEPNPVDGCRTTPTRDCGDQKRILRLNLSDGQPAEEDDLPAAGATAVAFWCRRVLRLLAVVWQLAMWPKFASR